MTGFDEIPEQLDRAQRHPLDGHEARERIRITLKDGRVVEGSYSPAGTLHFLHQRGPGLPILGEIIGPLRADEIASVEVLQTRQQVLEEARDLVHGPRVPGREPVTRDEFEHRLQTLARAVAAVPREDWQLQVRLRRQFDACADRMSLSSGKRAWVLAEARWTRTSNALPTFQDLWGAPMASPSCFARPRPQDFDPDPAARRRRNPLPPEIRADPRSVPNMLAALVERGLRCRITRQGDPPWMSGHIQVEMPVKGRARYILVGERRREQMIWTKYWDGNESKAGLARRRRAEGTAAYRQMTDALSLGRRALQRDLFS